MNMKTNSTATGPGLKFVAVAILLLIAAFYFIYPKVQPVAPDGKITVVATFFPLYEFTKAVAGERATVVTLIPAGVEPHDWDPSPQDMGRVVGASVFVYNGAGLEPWASSMLTPSMKTVNAYQASGLSGLQQRDAEMSASVREDPHVWLDPIAAKRIVASIADALSQADKKNADYYMSNAAGYSKLLDALDSEIRETVSSFRSRKYVALHPAFEYFNKRYGLEQVAYVEEVPGREPSAFQMAQFIETAKSNNITVIFIEPFVDPKPALSIAMEIQGGRVLTLDPAEIGRGLDYFAVMRENVGKLREALG